MVKNMCFEQEKIKKCVHCTVYILKNLPGEVETATWTDQDELTCTEKKLDIARKTKLICLINDWIITCSKEILLYVT
jgi:hypothetical protein